MILNMYEMKNWLRNAPSEKTALTLPHITVAQSVVSKDVTSALHWFYIEA